jgi:hypothetical protein
MTARIQGRLVIIEPRCMLYLVYIVVVFKWCFNIPEFVPFIKNDQGNGMEAVR